LKITHTEDYRTLRKQQMPDAGDQLDALWKIIETIVSANPVLKAALEAIPEFQKVMQIKAKIPKPPAVE
jgi:hypothetical protein